jgi:hypothetical protein
MKIDLSKATFIIPIRLESDDRIRNVITSTCFILENFDTNVIIKEVDSESVFNQQALPQIKEYLGDISKIKHIFEKSDSLEFHRQRVLNEMIMEVSTEIVVNYDCDALLPIHSYQDAYNLILSGDCDIVYPYGQGVYQKQVQATDDLVSEFLSNDFDFSILDAKSNDHTSDYGWVQFFNRQVYIDGGLENENFVAYAPEDKERFYRFNTLGYNICRIEDFVYHLEHKRGPNSWFTNPYQSNNQSVWQQIQEMDKNQLLEYYSKQDYLKKYVSV